LNQVRILSLFFLAQHRADLFQAFHQGLWPAALVLCAATYWLLWAQRVRAR
jgi:chromate transport protein ChrA